MKEIKGDLLQLAREGQFDLIVHGCNCFCTMGSGIAKQIHEEFPEAYNADLKTKKGDITKLGNFSMIEINSWNHPEIEYPFLIINLYSQFGYGTDRIRIEYDALSLGLKKLNTLYPNKKIGLPKIGAGLAGGDWNRIKNIIEDELNNMDVTIVYYEPKDRFSRFAGTALFPNT